MGYVGVCPDQKALTIARKRPKYPFLKSPSGMILLVRTLGPPTDWSKEYARIAHANEQPLTGFVLRGVRQLSASKGVARCWEMSSPDSADLSISCSFDKDTLGASYYGSFAYRAVFYKVLASVSAPPSRGNH